MQIDYFKLVQNISKDIIDKAIQAGIVVDKEMTLGELVDALCEYYNTDVYNLLLEIEDNFYFMLSERDLLYVLYDLYTSIRRYCIEVEEETGETVIKYPQLIYTALFRMLIDSYNDFALKDLE